VSFPQDGTGPSTGPKFRAPAFLRVKPNPPQAAAEHVAGRQLAPAVVCEVGWVNGLGAIRSLGRSGIPVVAVDHRAFAIGFRSSYAFPVFAPDPVADEEGFVASMVALGDALESPSPVFPTHDEHLNSLARHKSELGERFRYPFPDWSVLEPLQSKRHQLETAESLGIAAPRTLHPHSREEARAAAREIGFPVLVKPSDNIVFKRLYRRQAFLCGTDGELDRAYELAAEYEPMVQEFIPGGDDLLWTLGTYIAADGEVLATFSGRKLRQTRENMGSARVGEAVWDDEVVGSGLDLLRALGFHGIAQVEWKRDPRDGLLKLIEVNPRLWQWHGLAGACGADVTLAAYWDLVGDRRPAKRTEGCRKRWSISVMHGQSPAFERPPYIDGVFALDDPKPALVNVVRYVLRAFPS
jgi:predicted ATP-grasp superfamily ATP-dependent carboligase